MDINTQDSPIKPFPSIKQCFIIVGIIVLSSIIFGPIKILLGVTPIELVKNISFFLYYFFSFGTAALLVYIYKKHKEKQTYINPRFNINDWALIALVIIGAIALQIAVTTPVLSLIPMPEFLKKAFENMGNEMTGFWGIITIIVLAPIFEEYIFRGVMLDGLLKRFSPTKSILISSLFFGLVHFNPWQFISAMGIGIFAGWIYYKTKNLLLCILIHFANNSWATLGMHIFQNDNTDNEYATNKLIYILPALALALICICILKTRLYPKENKDLIRESNE